MRNAKAAIVGGFVLGGLALALATILFFGSMKLLKGTVHSVAYFPGSIAGLEVGAPVTFRGVRVGSVTAITVHLDATDQVARIPVYLELDPTKIVLEHNTLTQKGEDFERMLKAGLRAQLVMQSLITGELRVDLDVQPGSVSPLINIDADRPEIPTIPSKLQTLEDQIISLPLKEIAENSKNTLASLQQLADQMNVRIASLADDLGQTAQAGHMAFVDIDRLAVTSQNQVSKQGEALGRVMAASDATLQETRALILSLEDMTAPNSRMRGDLQATVRDLAASASSLRGFTHEIERNPSSILTGKTGP